MDDDQENLIKVKKADSSPCGLINVGNTCYFNSLLQILFSIPRFRHIIHYSNRPIKSAKGKVEEKSIEMVKEMS
jgi:ubiquitin C-terminal hydrolase